ncbi:MAG TPA: class I SAM-dependent methyltransferase [Verrucomicrobiae bacterium]|nr:class I SAM-dependent methyltransferase [Verrucomicrobiae bacterium]
MPVTNDNGSLPRLRLRATAAAETALRGGHPWLFADSVREQNREGKLGELAVIFDRNDRFLAVGLFDPESPIRVRILHAGKPCAIDDEWWRARLQAALGLRQRLFDQDTTGYRCINGESDGWPGLVMDKYDRTLVMKIYTAAWLPRLDAIVTLITSQLAAERLVLRLSRNIQKLAETAFSRRDGQALIGDAPAGPVIFQESGLRFEADVLRGQKTGFFLDQRENRRLVETLARGRTVLNAFSFTGGFSVYAARGGASSVTDVDISEHALAGGERNFQLNQAFAGVARCHHEAVQADAFEWLAKTTHKFDLVILDPPSLAKRENERAGAIRAYQRLAEMGLQRLNRNGILMAASCSAHVTADEYFDAVVRTTIRSGRKFNELRRTRQAVDHPALFAEMEYLKAIFLTLD